jgi:hypothetical protein
MRTRHEVSVFAHPLVFCLGGGVREEGGGILHYYEGPARTGWFWCTATVSTATYKIGVLPYVTAFRICRCYEDVNVRTYLTTYLLA